MSALSTSVTRLSWLSPPPPAVCTYLDISGETVNPAACRAGQRSVEREEGGWVECGQGGRDRQTRSTAAPAHTCRAIGGRNPHLHLHAHGLEPPAAVGPRDRAVLHALVQHDVGTILAVLAPRAQQHHLARRAQPVCVVGGYGQWRQRMGCGRPAKAL